MLPFGIIQFIYYRQQTVNLYRSVKILSYAEMIDSFIPVRNNFTGAKTQKLRVNSVDEGAVLEIKIREVAERMNADLMNYSISQACGFCQPLILPCSINKPNWIRFPINTSQAAFMGNREGIVTVALHIRERVWNPEDILLTYGAGTLMIVFTIVTDAFSPRALPSRVVRST